MWPIVKLLKRTIEDERHMDFNALETALVTSMKEIPRPPPVPVLTNSKVLVGVGRAHR